MPERRESRRNKRHKKKTVAHPLPNVNREIPGKTSLSINPSRGRARFILAAALCAADLFSRRYDLHQTEPLSSYGHDFLGAPLWWLLTQGAFPRLEFFRSRKNILLATALSFGFEGFQYILTKSNPEAFSQPILGLRFAYDPKDLIAYTLGTAAAFGLHRMLYGGRPQQ